MEKITLVTGNSGKAEEASRYLGIPVDHMSLDLQEIQSLDLEEIVRDKAERAYEKVGRSVLIEDVSFTFNALGRLPGPLIKWFEKELALEGICRLLDGKEDKSCVATVCYGFHDGSNIHLTKGSMSGSVADHPRGTNSFGWASIFIPEGMTKTYAELTNEEQAPIAMRRKALSELSKLLADLDIKEL